MQGASGDDAGLSNLPEWKKALILKKRAEGKDKCHRMPPEHHKRVTIGHVNVALRNSPTAVSEENNSDSEDLHYGPGIVDRLRAKFQPTDAKTHEKAIVRRFCSLENLPGTPNAHYRPNVVKKPEFNPVKKAQSMETLVSPSPEQNRRRRPNSDDPTWFRVLTPKINEDELPKPDTVKHVKKLFESPPATDSEKPQRFRKMPTTCSNGDITRAPVKKVVSAKPNSEVIKGAADNSPVDKIASCEIPKEPTPTRSMVTDAKKSASSSTSVVFDFRDRKDIEPHIALIPAPFGCRSGLLPVETAVVTEDWDELDIGADLPAISGIVFEGENVKVGRGAMLTIRNKKLNIQFDDDALTTYEYPSENSSPSKEENEWVESFNSEKAMSSAANARLGLSNYTPQVLNASEEFEFGVSQSKHRPTATSPEEIGKKSVVDAIIPAGPDDTVDWSATDTADILF